MYVKRVCKNFEIKNLREYHDLYIWRDLLLLAGVFENLRKMCFEVYKLDLVKFISVSKLAWQGALKKTGVELDLLTDIDMFLTAEKVGRGGISKAVHRYAKFNNKIYEWLCWK